MDTSKDSAIIIMDTNDVPDFTLHALQPPLRLIFSPTLQHLADLLAFYHL